MKNIKNSADDAKLIFPMLNGITSTLRGQGSDSCEDNRFPTMWPRFDYITRLGVIMG